jgi:hypothetical protein
MPSLVAPPFLIGVCHCGALDIALKINPHRSSAFALKTREDLVPRRGLEPPPTYVDQHLKLRIPWAIPPILRQINGLTIGGQ